MVSPSAKSIVLIRFPFSDLSRAKLRPALILAGIDREDWILSQITSQPYSDPKAIELNRDDYLSGSLRIKSFVRPGKLFTANQSIISRVVAKLKPYKFKMVISSITKILNEYENIS